MSDLSKKFLGPDCKGIENRVRGGAPVPGIGRNQGLGLALWETGSGASSDLLLCEPPGWKTTPGCVRRCPSAGAKGDQKLHLGIAVQKKYMEWRKGVETMAQHRLHLDSSNILG